MSSPIQADPRQSQSGLLAFAQEAILCFMLFTLVLVCRYQQAEYPGDPWLVHTGILQDLAAELPSGRQAFVCSPAFMPLPGMAALPFLPFLPAASYGYAYLYGLAVLLALSVTPLRALLRQYGGARLEGAACLLLALAAAALGPTGYSDLLACLAMLILALHFESRDLGELKALAGVFWGLALFSHAVGFALVALRVMLIATSVLRRGMGAEEKAVRWIQGCCVVYILSVYLFLNWMIMGSWFYPMRTASWRYRPTSGSGDAAASLAAALDRFCPGRTPVVSGHWGYVIRPMLSTAQGYHFMDFHPAKLPAMETRSLVLVIPAPGNPLAFLSDLRPDRPEQRFNAAHYLQLARTSEWLFYIVEDPDINGKRQ